MSNIQHRPYWKGVNLPRFPKLGHDLTADVVVVGGGMTGLMTAYFLAESGKSVVVLERERCASGETGRTSAHLTMVTDMRLNHLVSRFGKDHAQAVWDAGFSAIREIERIAIDEKFNAGFDWLYGYLHLPRGGDPEEGREEILQEVSLAQEFGFDAEFVEAAPLVGTAAARFGSQARFHPRKYLAGLLRALSARGVRIFEHSEAAEFKDSPPAVQANGRWVNCEDVVLATHNPLLGQSSILKGMLAQTKLYLYTSYVVAGRVPKGRIDDSLWWDTSEPYTYFRVDPRRGYDIVVFGGEDHKTGQQEDTEDCYTALEKHVRRILPEIKLTHRWSGQVIETPDGLPYIGLNEPHQYVATGFIGNGFTFGTLGGMIISDLITGRSNPWADLFAPDRKALRRGVWNYLRENKDFPYYLVRDRLFGRDALTLRTLRRGQGAILVQDGKTVAASRDQQGRVTIRSAACTHLGCYVRWNDAEGTWDCPCHGSRFTPDGAVLSGPAEEPLGKVDLGE